MVRSNISKTAIDDFMLYATRKYIEDVLLVSYGAFTPKPLHTNVHTNVHTNIHTNAKDVIYPMQQEISETQ